MRPQLIAKSTNSILKNIVEIKVYEQDMATHLLATQEGIKRVGVGKRGSQPLTEELISRIQAEFAGGMVPDPVKGAFLAGLVMKGPTEQEMALNSCFDREILADPRAMTTLLAAETPDTIQQLCYRLLCREELSREEAQNLGRYLFSTQPGDAVRGMVASLLRVRYETAEEYEGLLQSMSDTFRAEFRVPVPAGRPVAMFSEPFDGVDRSYMITPLLMDRLQSRGFRVIGLCGRNSGPKYGNNLNDLAVKLHAHFLRKNADFTDDSQPFGWFLNQESLSPALDRWVDIRRQIIKRPFLATLERFVDPCAASVLIASAFHPPYGEKMLNICERAGFPAAVIVRNGMEGTIAFPLIRQARLLCTVRQSSGEYVRKEIIFDAKTVLRRAHPKEERIERPALEENVRLIQQYKKKGRTDYRLFDDRVKVTCAGLLEALEWIDSQKEMGDTHALD